MPRRWPNIGLTLGHRLLRWLNIKQILGGRFVFAGYDSKNPYWTGNDYTFLKQKSNNNNYYIYFWNKKQIQICNTIYNTQMQITENLLLVY